MTSQRRQFHASIQTDNANSTAQVSDHQADNTNPIDNSDITCVEEDIDVLELGEKEIKGK